MKKLIVLLVTVVFALSLVLVPACKKTTADTTTTTIEAVVDTTSDATSDAQ